MLPPQLSPRHSLVASTTKAQTINDETQIHALVDGKKIDIIKSSVRIYLQFADEDGTECLPTTTIFENLKLMGYKNLSDKLTFFKSYFSHQWKFLVHTILQCLSPKKTAWNEFSSNIASTTICLATNQKFNFSKMVFDGMTRNLDSLSTKILMYPRFLQVFLDKQLDKVPSHNPVYNVPCHTKKFGKATTTASSLEAKQVSSNITKTRSKATLNEPTPQGTGSGSGPRRQDTMGDIIARTRFENVSKTSYDLPLGGVNTPQSDDDSMQLKELMEMYTNLLQRVQDLETTKTAQGGCIQTGRNIAEIDVDVDISLVHEDARIQGRFDDEDMFDTSVFNDEEVFSGHDMVDQEVNVAKKEVSVADPVTTAGEVIKGHVRNRNKPEGCIAEETIAEETIEFFSEYHKSMETIGIPPDKHETDENEEGKPLSAGKSSEVSAELFQKAHLYVIQNTDEIVPYIERHKQVLKTENPGKRIAFLENEHSKSFAKCLRKEVERELAISKRKCIRNYEYKDNGRFLGSKSGCNESDVKPYWKVIEKAKACMLAKAQASEASSKSKGRGTLEVESDVNLLYDIMYIEIIKISSDSSEDRKGASKATAPIFYGPSTKGLLDAYGYNTIEEYLSWNYFPSTDMETTNKRNTDKDCIVDSNSAMSKCKYAPVCKKHKPNMYSHVPVIRYVLGLPNVTTWDEIEK
ncbi:reverse transcriptase domain-containing protein [Tanacetum coccineum]